MLDLVDIQGDTKIPVNNSKGRYIYIFKNIDHRNYISTNVIK